MATKLEEARSYMAALETEMRDYAQLDETTPEQDARFDEVRSAYEAATPDFQSIEARAKAVEDLRAKPANKVAGSFEYLRPTNTDIDVRTASRAEARDVAEAWSPFRTVGTWYLWRSLDPLPVAY